jgi:Flp pilus assembly protein TadD
MMRESAGQIDAALAAFRNAEFADPTDADIPYELAVMLTQINRPEDARKAVQRSLQIRPDYAPAKELLRNLGP